MSLPASRELFEIGTALARHAVEAGRAILALRARGAPARDKADGSPVTDADIAAQEVMAAGVHAVLPGLAIVSEEDESSWRDGLPAGDFVAIDPLDGTRDFVAGNDAFTVNVALVRAGHPVVGVVHAPAMGRLFMGETRAWHALVPQGWGGEPAWHEIRARAWPGPASLSLESRMHPDPLTVRILDGLAPARRVAIGSSVKFGLIAAGEADVYVRANQVAVWDVAAGQAVLTAAGGAVTGFDGRPQRYDDLRVSGVLALGDPAMVERAVIAARAALSAA
jgi:3'(2'), 5'-bisphosphate nucleotidase